MKYEILSVVIYSRLHVNLYFRLKIVLFGSETYALRCNVCLLIYIKSIHYGNRFYVCFPPFKSVIIVGYILCKRTTPKICGTLRYQSSDITLLATWENQYNSLSLIIVEALKLHGGTKYFSALMYSFILFPKILVLNVFLVVHFAITCDDNSYDYEGMQICNNSIMSTKSVEMSIDSRSAPVWLHDR